MEIVIYKNTSNLKEVATVIAQLKQLFTTYQTYFK